MRPAGELALTIRALVEICVRSWNPVLHRVAAQVEVVRAFQREAFAALLALVRSGAGVLARVLGKRKSRSERCIAVGAGERFFAAVSAQVGSERRLLRKALAAVGAYEWPSAGVDAHVLHEK